MSIRWLLVLAILVWLAYEYTNHMWMSVWQVDTKTIKCGFGLLLIVLLVAMPSIEQMMENTDVNTFLRKVLVNEHYSDMYDVTHHVSPEILYKMKKGASFVPHTEGGAGVGAGAGAGASPT